MLEYHYYSGTIYITGAKLSSSGSDSDADRNEYYDETMDTGIQDAPQSYVADDNAQDYYVDPAATGELELF